MRTNIAIILSVALVAGVSYLAFSRSVEVGELKLNEIGDFVAGIGSLLALLWLIFGYFQQGQELKQNTEALKGQQQELNRQAKETAQLVRFAKAQASAMEAFAKSMKDSVREDKELSRATKAQADATKALARSIEQIRYKIR